MAETESIRSNEAQTEAFAETLIGDATATFKLFSVYLADRLGLYEALARDGPSTAAELAGRTDADERYVRELLEHQTVAGVLSTDDETAPAADRRYALPAAHEPVLVDRDSLYYLAPLARLVAGCVSPLEAILEAYRTGEGVPYADYGEDAHEGIAAMNRPWFLRRLGEEWLPSLPDVHERLTSEPPARVADVGCGHGWSSIGISRSYPLVRVDGFDLDESSVEVARANATASGVDDRVSFEVRDAADPTFGGRYDLVTAFECIHDMADPVGALRSMRRLADESGTVLVMDERVGDEFTAAGTDFEPLMYGFSVFHCLPVGRVDRPSAATGTVMRTDTLRGYAEEAGFESAEVLPIANDFWRFYRLTP